MVERLGNNIELPRSENPDQLLKIYEGLRIVHGALHDAGIEDSRLRVNAPEMETVYDHSAFRFCPERGGLVIMSDGERMVRLTPTESKLLEIMLKKNGRVAMSSDLAEAFPNTKKDPMELAKWHISQIRRKLEPEAREERDYKLIVSVRGFGYMLSTNAPVS